jgi:formylglycine-generating enzyme required for sulfatase activity
MPLIPDQDLIEESLAALPLTKFQAGEVVLLAGSRSEQLLFLKKGTVAIVKDGIEIARVTQSGAVLGELSVLLNQSHTADVRAVEASQFLVASADILARDPVVLFYVAAVLAGRLNATNRVFVELKTQLAGQRGGVVGKTIEKMEGLLGGDDLPAMAQAARLDCCRARIPGLAGLEAACRGWKEAPDSAKSDALLMGASLTQAQSWRAKRGEDLPAVDREFIEHSTKHESKVKARARYMRALVHFILLGIIAGIVGWINQSYLRRQWYWYTQLRPYVLSPDAERALKPGDTFRECAKGCPEMVVVPAGDFMMGLPTNEEGRTNGENPQHKVTIAAPFAVSEFEVTFDEWDTCAAYGDCDPQILDNDFGRGRKPVINVSWYDAQRYAAWLSKMTGKSYRLLSEAEWEYAARAGTKTSYSWGDEIGKRKANCLGCGSEWDGKRTAPVGSFAANAFGLHDMHGNASEWVEDCYHANYDGAPADGLAWTAGGDCSSRILRGGGWNSSPVNLRSASRGTGRTFRQSNSVGFRVARTLTR